MKKREAMEAWVAMPEGQDPLPHMTPISAKAKGSRYGACGIRIDGNPAFIDAVLSRLKPLLKGEGLVTRLELARNNVNTGFKDLPNAPDDAECCYIRLHQRGG